MPLLVVRYVDDLRFLNAATLDVNEDKALLEMQLMCLKDKLEFIGIEVHDKPGKLIPPTQEVEWLGWCISTTRPTVTLTPDKGR